jgi:hypothetical protein
MRLAPPDILEHERTPLVLLLLDFIHQQHQRIAPLKDEIATLKGLKLRPTIRPSTLDRTGSPARVAAVPAIRARRASMPDLPTRF